MQWLSNGCAVTVQSRVYIYMYIYGRTQKRISVKKKKKKKTVLTATRMQRGRLCEEGSEKAVPNSNSRAETKAVPNSNSREERNCANRTRVTWLVSVLLCKLDDKTKRCNSSSSDLAARRLISRSLGTSVPKQSCTLAYSSFQHLSSVLSRGHKGARHPFHSISDADVLHYCEF